MIAKNIAIFTICKCKTFNNHNNRFARFFNLQVFIKKSNIYNIMFRNDNSILFKSISSIKYQVKPDYVANNIKCLL